MTKPAVQRCYGCGKPVEDHADTCTACGSVQTVLCECGRTFSIYLDACPHCGAGFHPKQYRRRVPVLKILIPALLVAAAGAVALWTIPRDEQKAREQEFNDALVEYLAGTDAIQAGDTEAAKKRLDQARVRFLAFVKRHGEDARARYMIGMALELLGDREAAVKSVRTSYELDPELGEAAQFLAMDAYQSGNFVGALDLALQAIPHLSHAGRSHFVAGRVLSHPGFLDVERATEHLKQAVVGGLNDSEAPEAYLLLAELALARERAYGEEAQAAEIRKYLKEGRDRLEALLEKNPDDPALLYNLARLEYDAGQYDRAHEFLVRSARTLGDSPPVRLLRGKIDWMRMNRGGAIATFRSIVSDEADPGILLEVAGFCVDEDRRDLAEEVLLAARKLYPDHTFVLLYYARFLLAGDRAADAIAEIRNAPEELRSEPRVELALADALLATEGGEEEVEEILRRLAAEAEPGSPTRLRLAEFLIDTLPEGPGQRPRVEEAAALLDEQEDESDLYGKLVRAKLLLRQQRRPEAIRILTELSDRAPQRTVVHNLLARAWFQQGEYERAARELSALIRIAGARPSLLLRRADAWLALGPARLLEAVKDIEAAREKTPDDPEVWLLRARAHLAASPAEYEAAEECYEKAATLPGGRFAAHRLRGRLRLSLDDLEGAEEQFHLAEAAAETTAQRWDVKQDLAEIKDRVEEMALSPGAREILESYLERHPEDLTGRLEYAMRLFEAGEVEAARKRASEVLALDPASERAYRILFECCFAPGAPVRRERAGDLVDELAAHTPDTPSEDYMRGKLALFDGERDRAIELLRRADERSPWDATISLFLGRALRDQGDLKAARKVLERSVRLDPRILNTRQLLSEVAGRQGAITLAGGDPYLASKDLRLAARADPAAVGASDLLARSLYLTGIRGHPEFLEEAENECLRTIQELRKRRAAESSPDGPDDGRYRELLADSVFLLGAIRNARQDRKGLVEAYAAYQRLEPNELAPLLLLGRAHLRAGQPGEAEKVLAVAAKLFPESWLAVGSHAEALFAAGRGEEAMERLDAWLAGAPDDARAWLVRGRFLAAEDPEEARTAYARALEHDPDLLPAAERLAGLEGGDEDLRATLDRTNRPGEIGVLLGLALQRVDPSSEDAVGVLRKAVAREFEDRALHARGYEALLRGLIARGELEAAVEAGDRFARWSRKQTEVDLDDDLSRAMGHAWFTAGLAHHLLDDPAFALRRYRRALELSPDYPPLLNNLAEILIVQNRRADDVREAVRRAQAAVDRVPGAAVYHDTLGYAHLRLGEVDDALRALRKAESLFLGRLTAEKDEEARKRIGADLAASLVRQALAYHAAKNIPSARSALVRAEQASASVKDSAEYQEAREKLAE